MKLNSKFLLIVAVTTLEIFILAFASISSTKKITKFKDYQTVQASVNGEISDILLYLYKMDYNECHSTVALREFESKVNALESDFDILLHDSITNSFSDELKQNLESSESLWEILHNRFESLYDTLGQIQGVKLTQALQTEIQTSGIRESYEKFPDIPEFERLYDLILEVHEQIPGIVRSNNTLAKLTVQSTYQFREIITSIEKRVLFLSILLTCFSCISLTILILSVTTGVTKRINSVKNISSTLAEKDFSVSIKPEGSTEMRALMTNINNMVTQINDFFIVVKTTASKAISSGYMITDSANSTAAAASQIDGFLNSMQKEFEEISTTVTSAVNAIEEMNHHIEVLTTNNKSQTEAIQYSNNAVNNAVETLEYVNKMALMRTQGAQEMHFLIADGDSKISKTGNILKDTNSKLDEIKEVVTIINGVANKTNLLSMNAAIESAHAGAAGKGFGVVAAEIRSLAEATQKNSVRISEVVQNVVNSLALANEASTEASVAFKKVSNQAGEIVSSLQEMSAGIGQIDEQMQTIKTKSGETSKVADEIDSYCGEIKQKQKTVFDVVNSVKQLFSHTVGSFVQIKKGTHDIVQRMRSVSDSSKESYKNMTDLENILEEFKTSQSVIDAVEKVDSESIIENAVSEELKDLNLVQDFVVPENAETVEFDIDSVTEYKA